MTFGLALGHGNDIAGLTVPDDIRWYGHGDTARGHADHARPYRR
ncbi:hypothetical protein [Streptomyces misionensis]